MPIAHFRVRCGLRSQRFHQPLLSPRTEVRVAMRALLGLVAEANALLANIHTALPELDKLLEVSASHWGCEDLVYRFYRQSFKVYGAQQATERIVEALRKLAPKRDPDPGLNEWFEEVIRAGTGKTFEMEHNEHWLDVTRPILEAFFHAGSSWSWFANTVGSSSGH